MPLPPLPARPPWDQRPRRAQRVSDEFECIEEAHRAAMRMLDVFQCLVAHLDDHGLDVTAEALAARLLGFFEGPGRCHHEDEERLVFPELAALGDEQLRAQVQRLRQDHLWIEQDWLELMPHIMAVAEGYNGYNLPLLQAALPVFEALYMDHIALEESVVYPAARRARAAAQARLMA